MRVTWKGVLVVFVVAAGLGLGCDSGKKPASAPGASPAPAKVAETRGGAARDAGAATDAGPQSSDPLASRFRPVYLPGETVPDALRQRIRSALKDKSRAPVALHHVIDVPRPDGGREVFALYEYSVHEDCMARWPDRKVGREHCQGKLASVFDGEESQTDEDISRNGHRYRYKQIRLNENCVALGVVRAVFGPPGPGGSAETGGALAISSRALSELRCTVRSYDHVLVADVDGDGKLELYLELATEKEDAREVRGLMSRAVDARRSVYLLSGDDVARTELSFHDVEVATVELRDLDRDGHLDMIQTTFCISDSGPCGPPSGEQLVHVYDAAKDAYRPAVASRDFARRLHDRAMKSLAAKQLDAAVQSWRDAAEIDPTWSWPPYNLACVAALQGHADDAIAQIRLLIDRAPDLDVVHRLETDRDLAALRDLPAFQQAFGEVVRAALDHRGFSRPAGDGDIPACAAISFFSDGRYWYTCDKCCRFSGKYTYAPGGRIQIEISTLERQGQGRYEPPEPVEVRGTYQLTTQDKQACFERVEATGLSDDLPSPPLPDGCWN
ncbi:MAG: tetratricopeptide repeat protein [Deltaproteobacteria bacterium]|nr:MAG: tetratricopeptide repeat protein [Deltaproteobacteria bacterium]